MEVDMRIRRNILAPTILMVGTIGSLSAGHLPALTITTAPASASVSACFSPNGIVMHG
jgi:hypothetical protein